MAWYKFDEASGTTAVDSSGRGHHGTFVAAQTAYTDSAPMLGVSGAINDNSTAVHFGTLVSGARAAAPMVSGQYAGQYMSAATASDLSLTKGSDTFNRDASGSSSWGTPSTGAGNWAWLSTNGNYYGVTTTGLGGGVLAGAYINQSAATGTFGQSFPAQARLDTDTQVDVSWVNSGFAGTTTGTYQPLILTARFADSNNYYAARITETNGSIKLAIIKKEGGSTTYLYDGSTSSVTLATTYDYTVQWRVRFQIESDRSVSPAVPTFRAKAWKVGDSQPGWALTATDPGTPLAAGGNSIISSNSSTNNHSYVTFDNYRLQSTGFTVSTWIRPTTESFTNNPPATLLCNGGSTYANLTNFVSKSGWIGSTSQSEWHLRHYPGTALDTNCGSGATDDRRGALSAYAFSLSPVNGTGAGDRFNPNPDGGLAAIWHHVVAVYDPGDYTDLTAGVLICVDGTCYPRTTTDGGALSDANYAHSAYVVDPASGTSPLRVGAGYGSSWNQFQGDIDELSIYEYRLTTTNIADMYSFKK